MGGRGESRIASSRLAALRRFPIRMPSKPWPTKVIEEHPDQVSQYLSGKEKVFGFLVGQIMKASRGQADPKRINEILRRRLNDASE